MAQPASRHRIVNTRPAVVHLREQDVAGVEAGYTLGHHGKGRLVFLFKPRDENDNVPFDLTTFKYVRVGQAAEIPKKLGGETEAILAASRGLQRG